MHDFVDGVAASETSQDREDGHSIAHEGHASGVEPRVDRHTGDADLERDGVVVVLEDERLEVVFEDFHEGVLIGLHSVEIAGVLANVGVGAVGDEPFVGQRDVDVHVTSVLPGHWRAQSDTGDVLHGADRRDTRRDRWWSGPGLAAHYPAVAG
ncbi:hypothetical protein [Intrasporangium sp.]|uniref:hypothetical protein n=1 Tax=Intrasporangium sp. TaxID=1925024 RepID=UPI0034641F05